ncbi:MAG: DUF3795 domain-containing protein [Promethearchaeota archaeon]
MVKNYKINPYGLNCDLCDANTSKIQEYAKYLLNVFEDPLFIGILSMTDPKFKPENIPTFKQILKILNKFPPCSGCEGRGDCVVNQCVQKKNIENCSMCEHLNIQEGICSALLEPSEVLFFLPAPIFFNKLSERYQKWNIKNLDLIKQGKKGEVDKKIANIIKEGKTNRDLIDTSINLFDQMKDV